MKSNTRKIKFDPTRQRHASRRRMAVDDLKDGSVTRDIAAAEYHEAADEIMSLDRDVAIAEHKEMEDEIHG